jgi:hypothetical protein
MSSWENVARIIRDPRVLGGTMVVLAACSSGNSKDKVFPTTARTATTATAPATTRAPIGPKPPNAPETTSPSTSLPFQIDLHLLLSNGQAIDIDAKPIVEDVVRAVCHRPGVNTASCSVFGPNNLTVRNISQTPEQAHNGEADIMVGTPFAYKNDVGALCGGLAVTDVLVEGLSSGAPVAAYNTGSDIKIEQESCPPPSGLIPNVPTATTTA